MEPKEESGQQKSDYSVFQSVLQLTGDKPGKLCIELGYSDTAWHTWKKTGKIPRVCAIACEAIKRRNGHADTILVVRATTKDQLAAIQAFAKAIGVAINEV